MDTSFDLPDSTDWIKTSLPSFEPLEAALRCEVCKEFYTNPVITSCNHTFCSICIRRCITVDGKCPSCKTGCSSDKLRPNIAVREVVLRFQEARPKAMELARADKEEEEFSAGSSKKRKLDDTDIEEDDTERHTRARQTRSRSQRNGGPVERPIVVADSDDDDDGDGDFVPDGMAKCPVCYKSMKVELVYNHLDICTGPNALQGRNTRSRTQPALPAALARRKKDPSPPPSRLSQLNYAMLKEGALRKKLQEIGIPNWGSKDLMRRRHIEWLNIYNSNCDADDSVRKNKRQLLKELDEWEQTQGGRADPRESKIMKKDFDGDGHAKTHKSDFDDLIAQARQKRDASKTASEDHLADEQYSEPRHSHTTPELIPLSDESPFNTYPPPSNTQNPYENNGPALASIRAKVEEAKNVPSKTATLTSDTSMESVRCRSSDKSEGIHNPFGTPNRKVPIFTLPEEPVKDMEGSTTL
ncbi:DNA repair protein rad18 [Decorospora gaudefroyi]|uniref:Postreplication repair E3 ubiquitin-protein ligase RAD18 n=1 Tax=Decorospora gaudefroyi TaxID=184978 RepID=A0A6A5KWX6_9PLEO|nr:DNA repair protein rad18 [Decorospora gaudefroyi]